MADIAKPEEPKLTGRWAEYMDDDYASDDITPGFIKVDGDTAQKVDYENNIKITTTMRLVKRNELKSAYSQARKDLMIKNAGDAQQNYAAETDKEVFIELPRSLRRFDDDTEVFSERPTPGPFQGFFKDTVKEKFNKLQQLEDEHYMDRMATPQDEEPGQTGYIQGSMRYNPRGKEEHVVRVTNLSEETTEQDLENLFGMIGNVTRIYLAREKDTKKSRGYAFITYGDAHAANEAIRRLDRHGHDSLLLRVELSKPNLRHRDG